ncbi:BREX-1 system adenine-specific DNA-methyltransferase PglX [Alphaproteobacteria bacterium]|nr:BREX-1 system adenine-specific DNA-methyltransferase PglX [Alphaproteobacteria bacterium]
MSKITESKSKYEDSIKELEQAINNFSINKSSEINKKVEVLERENQTLLTQKEELMQSIRSGLQEKASLEKLIQRISINLDENILKLKKLMES